MRYEIAAAQRLRAGGDSDRLHHMLGGVVEETVLLRSLWQGRVRSAYPTYRVASDAANARALFFPSDATYIRSDPNPGDHLRAKLDGSWAVVERQHPSNALIVSEVGRWFSVWLLWTTTWEYGGSYVNFERPWRDRPHGYDTSDLAVDIVVLGDGSWSWKDREEFDELVDAGAIDSSSAAAVSDEAQRVIADIRASRGLFDPGFQDWRPGRSLACPSLPSDWATV